MMYEDAYRRWLQRADGDPELREELLAIGEDLAAIEDRFYQELSFGTGGLRGVIGAGTNRMNVHTVAKATQGIAAYMLRHFEHPSVAIAYDSRHKSELFARTASSVFAANGVRVYLYPQLMPTPALSFAVRYLRASGGVVITASHNPAKYNGYKVYGSDGGQITDEAAAVMIKEINAVDPFDGVRSAPFKEALGRGEIALLGEEVRTAYLREVSAQSLLAEDVPRDDVSIVYTPLNGAGISCVPDCLRANGFTRVTIPEAQRLPDGDFPTCPYPNPEIQQALEVGLACAREVGADLLLATDPDCDRVGLAVRDGDKYTLLSGNQVGVLLLDYICRRRVALGTMPERPLAFKTIVTTSMAELIAARHGVELVDVLTGFKYIGEQIGLLERRHETGRFIFGFEESYGYLSGTFVRDKDAVNASLLICEMFADHRARGQSLVEALEALYREYGAFSEQLYSFEFEGTVGFARMRRIMDALRRERPWEILGFPVEAYTDYLVSRTVYVDGREEAVTLPKSDVLRITLRGGSSVVVRPSGTEPKLKLYLFARSETLERSAEDVRALYAYFEALIHDHQA